MTQDATGSSSCLEARELDSLLVTDLLNVRYLTGFTGTNGACVVTRGRAPVRDRLPLRRAGARAGAGYERIDGRTRHARRPRRAAARSRRLRRRGHERGGPRQARREGRAPASSWCPPVAWWRICARSRTPTRSPSMRAAAELATAAYESLRERGLAGRTEREVAIELVRFMEDRGAEGPSFPPIVASGPHGALPHATPRDVEIPRDTLVVIDMGALVDGYCSDCTRTLATGALDDGALEVYELVLRAQRRRSPPRARARPAGTSTPSRARSSTRPATAEHFGHGLGHGVGLEVHEGPRLGKTAEGELVGRQRGDGRAGRLPARRVRRADRGPRDRDRRRARHPHRTSRRNWSQSADAPGRGRGARRGGRPVGHRLRLRAGALAGAVRGARARRGRDGAARARGGAQRARAARGGHDARWSRLPAADPAGRAAGARRSAP